MRRSRQQGLPPAGAHAAQIFTDGSGASENIGAAAVLYRNGRVKSSLRYQLGPIRYHTVFEGEATGLLVPGLQLIYKYGWIHSANIYTEATTAITDTTTLKAHGDITYTTPYTKLSRYPVRIVGTSALKSIECPSSRRYSRVKSTDSTVRSKKYLKLVESIPGKHASILTQLRTGHIPLAKHLHRINRLDSPICPACRANSESVTHFILHCPASRLTRQKTTT